MRVTFRSATRLDQALLHPPGMAASIANCALLVVSMPRMVDSKYGNGSIRPASLRVSSIDWSVGRFRLPAASIQLTRTRHTFGAWTLRNCRYSVALTRSDDIEPSATGQSRTSA